MTISSKTRKLLWGKSGNLCSYCKTKLSLEKTDHDDESVVGEECHIVARSPNGPRGDPDYPKEKLDEYDNLILLCSLHHKVIDDQPIQFNIGVLKKLKAKHERWVSDSLQPDLQQEKKLFLPRISEGSQLLNIVSKAHSFVFQKDDPSDENEMLLISEFVQKVQDWGDDSHFVEVGDIVIMEFQATKDIKNLAEYGFFLFGKLTKGKLNYSTSEGKPTTIDDWYTAYIAVVRSDNSNIQEIEVKKK